MMTNKISIVLVDDHSIVRRGLVSFLGAFADLEVIGDAASEEKRIQQLEQWLPDVSNAPDNVLASRAVSRASESAIGPGEPLKLTWSCLTCL